MKPLFKNSFSLMMASLLLLAACAKEESTGNLQNLPPNTNDGRPMPTFPAGTNPSIPPLVLKSVEINRTVTDTQFLAQFSEMFRMVPMPPMVQSYVTVQIDDASSVKPTGRIVVGVEDDFGFLGGLLESVEGATSQDINNLEMIFTDNEVAMRVSAARMSDGKLNGILVYRVRGTEDTCFKKTYTCTKTVGGVTTTVDNSFCQTDIDNDKAARLTACKNYMSSSNSAVKQLGTFEAVYSNWVK